MTKKIYDDCFVVMSQYGIQRLTKRKGRLERGEIAVKIRLMVPESCFQEPDVSVVISIPESAVIKPTADVTVMAPNEADAKP